MGNKNANFVSHKKSKQKVDGKPQLPLASALVEGEIAINFAKDVETLSIKNESGDVVTFSSDNYYTEQKLGSGFTGENSAVTVTDVIDEIDLVTSTALNDLEERKLDVSAYTPTEELWVSGTGTNSVAQKGGNNTASGNFAVAEGQSTSATSYDSHAEGGWTLASGGYSHAEGNYTIASGSYSHAEGERTSATSYDSHAEGRDTLASGDRSHAEGYDTTASGSSSHAEGSYTKAGGNYSHAEGWSTTASGWYSHAEGNNTSATTYQSHAEGDGTTASGQSSHAEGSYTKAGGNYSHAEGWSTTASGWYSHAEGYSTITLNNSEHASGQYNVSSSGSSTFGDSGNTLFSVGNGTAGNARHNAFEIRQNGDIYIVSGNTNIKLQDSLGGTVDQVLDNTTSASTNAVSSKAVYKAVTDNELVWTNAFVALSGVTSAHTANTSIHLTSADKTKLDNITGTIGSMAYENTSSYSSATDVNTALGDKADTATTYTKTEVDARDLWVSGTGTNSVAQKGCNNTASGDYSHAEGYYTSATTYYAHAEGLNTIASGGSSHAEGSGTIASGGSSHAEGYSTLASSDSSHAEGAYSKAIGSQSHAEGNNTTASGDYSHAEGNNTKASGHYSHTEGNNTTASGYVSHAEGWLTIAGGATSHAEGYYAITLNDCEHASGRFNVSSSGSSTFGDSGNTLFSVGNGTAVDARHNAFEIRQNGDIYITSGNSDIKLQDYIGSVETVSAITPSNSGSTAPIATKVVAENELVMANALNDLSTNKADKTEDLDGIKLKKITQSAYDALVQAGTVDPNTLYFITD